MGKLLFSRKI